VTEWLHGIPSKIRLKKMRSHKLKQRYVVQSISWKKELKEDEIKRGLVELTPELARLKVSLFVFVDILKFA
jgi:hypothetical protein